MSIFKSSFQELTYCGCLFVRRWAKWKCKIPLNLGGIASLSFLFSTILFSCRKCRGGNCINIAAMLNPKKVPNLDCSKNEAVNIHIPKLLDCSISILSIVYFSNLYLFRCQSKVLEEWRIAIAKFVQYMRLTEHEFQSICN